MVGCTGIEPVVPEAPDLQSSESPLILPTHDMEQRAGFEPAIVEICSHLRWATPPPLHCIKHTAPRTFHSQEVPQCV